MTVVNMKDIDLKRKALGDLKEWLPPHVLYCLEHELNAFICKDPEGLKDESTMRYVFMSVLEYFDMACPHPWRNQVHERIPLSEMYECRMCRATVVFKYGR